MEDNANTIINVAGDYVQSKHVDYEINNVEAGGIGIQFLTKEQRTFPTLYTLHRTLYTLHLTPSAFKIPPHALAAVSQLE